MSNQGQGPLHLERGKIQLWRVYGGYPLVTNAAHHRISSHITTVTPWLVRLDGEAPLQAPQLITSTGGEGPPAISDLTKDTATHLRFCGFDFTGGPRTEEFMQREPPRECKFVVMKDRTFFLFAAGIPHNEAAALTGAMWQGRLDPVAVWSAGFVRISPQGVTLWGESVSLDREPLPEFDPEDAMLIAHHLFLPEPVVA